MKMRMEAANLIADGQLQILRGPVILEHRGWSASIREWW